MVMCISHAKQTMASMSRYCCSLSFYSFLRPLNRLEMYHQICGLWISPMAMLAHVIMLEHLNTLLHTSILTGYLKVMNLLGWILHIHVQFNPFLYTRSLPHQFHKIVSLAYVHIDTYLYTLQELAILTTCHITFIYMFTLALKTAHDECDRMGGEMGR